MPYRQLAFVALAALGALSTLVFPLRSEAAEEPILIDGLPVDCVKAVEFRDGRLVTELGLFLDNYDSDQAKREEEVAKKLNAQLVSLDKYWADANAATRKKLLSNGISLALLVAGEAAGTVAKGKAGLSEIDKKALDVIIDRSAAQIDLIQKAGFKAELSATGIAKDFTVSTVVAVFAPEFKLAWLVVQASEPAMEVGFGFYELAENKDLHLKGIEDVKAALKRIAVKSVSGKIAAVNILKNKIDAACNKL